MGASSSTVKDTILATFNRVDVGKKGYLTLKEVLRLPNIWWGIDPGHLGVLWTVDRDRNGLVTLDEALSFARHAAGLSRNLKARDTLTAGALTQGHCSLAMWRTLQQPGGRAAFVAWAVRLITHGQGPVRAVQEWDVECVAAAGVKNLWLLFDMERRQGLLLEEFSGLLLAAAEEQGIVPSGRDEGGCSERQRSSSGGSAGDGGAWEGEASKVAESASSSADEDAGGSCGDEQQRQGPEQAWGQQQKAGPPGAAAPALQDGEPGFGGERRGGLPAVPLQVVEDFLGAAYDGMGGVVEAIVDATELGEALGEAPASGGVSGGGAPPGASGGVPPLALRA